MTTHLPSARLKLGHAFLPVEHGDLNPDPQSCIDPTYLPSAPSREVRVLVVEECKVVGSVLGSTGFFSFMLVALGAGGTRPGTGEKRGLKWAARNLYIVQE